MRISDLRREKGAFGVRLAATCRWEDSDRHPVDLWWDVEGDLGESARPEPDAFLAAAFVPALRHGERRITVEGAVCPLLGTGLRVIGGLLRSWYPSPLPIPDVEPRDGWVAPMPRPDGKTAGYLTGGVDSLHLLHSNREDFPADHPSRISHAFWVRGLDYPGEEESSAARSAYERLDGPISEIAGAAGVRLVRITTNLRRLEPDLSFFAHWYLGGALLSGAHLLASRFSAVALGSSWPAERLVPWGTHPLLDVQYGSAAVSVRHEALGISRIEKLARLRGQARSLELLVTCSSAPCAEAINCGRCTKCVRTLLEMEASGTAAHARSFPPRPVTPETIGSLEFDHGTEYFWGLLVGPLRARGREEIASAIERKIRATVGHRRRVEGHDWTGPIRRFDRDFLGGRLKTVYRRLRP
jgi:hypothetical protein